MKARFIIKMMVMMMALYGVTACESDDTETVEDFSKAIGITWKLYGFGTVGEDEIQKAKPDKGDEQWKEENYTIMFLENGSLIGFTFLNEFIGKYSIQGNAITITDWGTSMAGEVYDGYKYSDALHSVTHFKIKNTQLLLYYNNQQNYLLFNK